uniref:Death domain-containing protein n=1 Tax=Amphimedon queenslandica TaxID=400682 RepID=A0A1X7TUW5_AMPQE
MFDKGVIMIGDVSALDSLIKLYRPSFFNQYTKRSKLTDTNSTITIPVQETMGNIATGQTETKKSVPAPTLPQLLKVLKPMRSRWAGLADQLDVSRPAAGGEGGDDLTCLGSVLREWMDKKDKGNPDMWREIKEAVTEMEENDVLIGLLAIMENL